MAIRKSKSSRKSVRKSTAAKTSRKFGGSKRQKLSRAGKKGARVRNAKR